MSSKTGAQLQPGDTFKDRDGRWYTLTAATAPMEHNGQPWPHASIAPVTDRAGEARRLVVFTGQAYALAGTTATPVTIRTYDGQGAWSDRTFEVTFTRRTWGGWHVRLASTGRLLGWVTRDPDGGWDARCAESAFRGTGERDEGNVLDDVPGYLFGGVSGGSGQIGSGRDRAEAAQVILDRLWDKSAPALGFGPHYAVRTWASRHGGR